MGPHVTPAAAKAKVRGPFRWHVDIDRILNPILPTSILPRLPHPVAHFLGYRSHPSVTGPLGNVAVVFWAAIGIFCSLSIIGAVAQQIPAFQHRGVPTIIGSFVRVTRPAEFFFRFRRWSLPRGISLPPHDLHPPLSAPGAQPHGPPPDPPKIWGNGNGGRQNIHRGTKVTNHHFRWGLTNSW